MTHKTKGIVLRSIRYGETSLVVTIFTALFGVQVYLVNGARSQKKSGNKSAMFQPGALLDLDVYHQEQKSMQRIKECNWLYLYENNLSQVIKNGIVLYMMELLYKTLKQPEEHADLFDFCEDALLQLDKANSSIAANFALFFTLQLTHFFGFKIHHDPRVIYDGTQLYIDFYEGKFMTEQPLHHHYIEGNLAIQTAELLKVMHPDELDQVKLNHQTRKDLLLKYQEYYRLHIADFGQLKTLQVLHELLS
jgi:DNA repair protein RecO (recombination protein O)